MGVSTRARGHGAADTNPSNLSTGAKKGACSLRHATSGQRLHEPVEELLPLVEVFDQDSLRHLV